MSSDRKDHEQSKPFPLKRPSHRVGSSEEGGLPQGEEHYRHLFNSIDEGFCIIEVLFDEEEQPMDFRYLEANPAFKEQAGLEDPAGKWARELVPDLEEYWFEAYGEVALSGQPRRFENESCALDRHFDVYAFRVGRPEKRRVAILFKDVTDRKEAEEARAKELAYSKRLHEISCRLIPAEDTETLYTALVAAAVYFTGAEMGAMQLIDEKTGELRLLATKGLPKEAREAFALVSAEEGTACAEALRRGERVVVSDYATDELFAGTEATRVFLEAGVRASQSTPLVSRSGQMVGMLTTHWQEPHEPDEQVLRLLDILARQAADLIDRLRAEEALKELNETLEERVKERTGQVEGLAAALAEAEEKERERIADVLHDDVQQQLFGTELILRQIRRRMEALPEVEAKAELEELLGGAEEAFDEAQESVRTLSVELSPPLLQGEALSVVLRWLARHFEERYGLVVELDLAEDFRLPDEAMRRFLFQLTRELLFNVVKHAEVEEARVEGRRTEEALLLKVIDEGRGFGEEEVLKERPEGRGLRALRNRLELLGGDMHIDTASGEGTHITIGVPFDAA